MPIAMNDKGEALRLSDEGQWVPTNLARNPQTGEELAFDGRDWQAVKRPVDVTREVGAVGAGLHRGFANTLGLPVDLANSAFRAAQSATPIGEQEGLIPGPGQVLGAAARLFPAASDNPVGGSRWIKDRFGDVGVDIDRKAQTSAGRIAARAGEELGGMAVPMAGAMAIPARELSATGSAIREALAGTGTLDRVGQAVVSAGAGAGAGVAQEAAPNSQMAELAGGLAGGLATGAGLGALQAGVSVAAPFLSQGAREAAAGAALRRFSANPDALETNLATAPREIVPGSKLTTAQAVQDPGLAALERTVRSEDPQIGGGFAIRDAERAAAQRAAIDAQAPSGPGATDVAAMARDRLERFQAAAGTRTDRMQGAVDRQAAALGGDAAPDTYGRTIRDELANGRQSAKGYEQQLWQRLQDRPDLALEVSGTRDAAQKMMGEIGPYAAAPEGDASSILGLAADLPDVLRYGDLQQLRSRIVQAQDGFTRAGNAVDARRLSAILTGIDDDLARAAGGDAAALPPPGQALALPPPTPVPAPVSAAARQEASSSVESAAPAPSIGDPLPEQLPTPPEPDALQPNFGPDEAALYRQARAATAERKGTYERGAVGDVLQQGGFRSTDGPYLRPDETVAARFFNAGRTSRTDVQQFLAAAGDREKAVQALREYAAGDLKRTATGQDGAIDPTKWRKWMDQRVAALRPFPELMRQMDSVGKAQSLVNTIGRQGEDAARAFEVSPAGKLVGDRDPDRAFAQILQGGNVTAGLRQLVRMAKGDAGQVRRAAVDYLLRSIENPGSVDAAGEVGLSTAKAARTVDRLAGPLQDSGLFGADHVAALRKVVEDMRRGVYAQNAGRAAGSNTYQNLSAASVLGQIGLGRLAESTLFASTVGRPVAFLLRIPDQEVRKLIADAMLDPDFALQLARRATPDRMEWVARSLTRRAAATGAGATAQAGSPRDQQPTAQR
ncbi:hypothetical protein [Azospirillum palustre]